MPIVLSDKSGALMTSPTSIRNNNKKKVKTGTKRKTKRQNKKEILPPLSPSVSFFLVKGKAT